MSQPSSCRLAYPVGMPPYGVLAACGVANVTVEASESSKLNKDDPICLEVGDWCVISPNRPVPPCDLELLCKRSVHDDYLCKWIDSI